MRDVFMVGSIIQTFPPNSRELTTPGHTAGVEGIEGFEGEFEGKSEGELKDSKENSKENPS
jgi:hypothetical protein